MIVPSVSGLAFCTWSENAKHTAVPGEENWFFPCPPVHRGNRCLKEPRYSGKVAYSVAATWQGSECFRSLVQCLIPRLPGSALSLMLCRKLSVPQPLGCFCACCIICLDVRAPQPARTSRDLNPTLGKETPGNNGILRYRVWGCENTTTVSEEAFSVSSWKTE